MKTPLLIAALAAFTLCSSPAAFAQTPVKPAAASAPAAMIPEDPTVTKRAMEWFGRFQSSDIDRSQLANEIAAKLTPPVLAAMKRQLAPLGAPTGIGYGGARLVKGNMVYRYVVVFQVGAIQEYMSLDKTGKISGVLFLPVR
jgi:hypothetical protein